MKQICENCFYSEKTPTDPNNIGAENDNIVCVRFPPVSVGGIVNSQAGPAMMVQSVYPVNAKDKTCGEFLNKEFVN